jgi:hypothetical protein
MAKLTPVAPVLQTNLRTFGDVRSLIIQSIVDIRSGAMATDRALATAAHFKVLNDNIQAEVAAAKVAILAREKGHDFGRVVQMGQQLIGHDPQLTA